MKYKYGFLVVVVVAAAFAPALATATLIPPYLGVSCITGPIEGQNSWSVIMCLDRFIIEIAKRLEQIEARLGGGLTPIPPTIPIPCIPGCNVTTGICVTCPIPGTQVPIPGEKPIVPGEKPIVPGEGGISIPTLGEKGEQVKVIQQFLKTEGSFKYPEATGYYGTITKEAVKNFQLKSGLPASGQIDAPTLNKMKTLAPSIAPSMSTQIQQLLIAPSTR